LVDAKPHVGGVISLGCSSVIIGNRSAARKGDPALCGGPPLPDLIDDGSPTVIIGGELAARKGDPMQHKGGKISSGCSTVIIGDPAWAGAKIEASVEGAAFCEF